MLITCSTPPISSPRAATSVATSTRQVPDRNAASAASRCDCVLSPWMSSAGIGAKRSLASPSLGPPLQRRFFTHVAVLFFCTKIRVRPLGPLCNASTTSLNFCRLSGDALIRTWVMLSVVLPTLPTAIHVYVRRNSAAIVWIFGGKVAENRSVWRFSLEVIPDCKTRRRICGSNPMSSIRSASSRTRKTTCANVMRDRSTKSVSRPGVATTMSAPNAKSRIWFRWLTPP